uniref:Uncharacterized protein n=1 Tax=Megaselia scalaris TaxID=36166 RepID=T1GTU0_MEGSC
MVNENIYLGTIGRHSLHTTINRNDKLCSSNKSCEQLASPTDEEQQKTVKYGRQLLINRNLIEGSSSLEMY